ncbi:MAG: M15 family metallopeptidase [Clostridia bacterium]|nr:M15 family metallopeptidase [Clostridia bacterium]
MFTKPVKVAVALLAAVMLLSACGGRKKSNYDYEIDMEQYEEAIYVTDESYLYLVNKQNPCGKSYAPSARRGIPADMTLYGKSVEMEKNAAIAAQALVMELHALGYTDIVVTSGYRSYDYQQNLFNNYLSQEKAEHPGWTNEQCRAEVQTYSALPGESEHQTGLCMDLISTNNVVLDESFAKNPAYDWLVENAHHFGFILRYPQGKEAVTGYTYEPWHYRFVGVEAATKIHAKGLTLEEYLD